MGDCIEDYIERTTIQNQYPVLTSSQKQGIVFQEDYFADRQVTTENNVGYFVLPKGYFTYRSRSDNGVFRFNRNDLIDKGIISYFYPVFRIKDNDSNFFLQLLNSTIDEQVSFEAEGTGQKVLSLKKFKNVVVTIPSLHEQATIGNFFKQLDETIALHQRQTEKYQKLKTGFLESIFCTNLSLNNSKKTNTWEQRKLGELGAFKNGMNLDNNAFGYGYPFVNLQDIFEKSEVNDSNLGLVYSTEKQRQEYNLLKGDILFVRSSVKIEGVGLTSLIFNDIPNATYSGFIIRFRPNIQINHSYKRIMFSTKSIRKQILSNATSSANTNINQDALKEIQLLLPTLEEQTAIGNFFKQLDETIALHQRQIEKYRLIKKLFLEKMFIK